MLSHEVGDNAVTKEELERNGAPQEALLHIASAMFSKLLTLVETIQLYTLINEEIIDWPEEIKSEVETGTFHAWFRS